MKEGLVVEQSTTPLNGSMEGLAEETKNCQPEVPQRAVFPAAHTDQSFLLTEGTGQTREDIRLEGKVKPRQCLLF
jgi:hypothetical protein